MPLRFAQRVYHKLLLVPHLPSAVRHIQSDYATIFMMHRVRDGDPGATGIDARKLRSGLDYLRRNGFELVSLTELFQRLAGEGPRVRGAVAFTVDDGYLDQAELAGPIFSEFDCPVTTFVTTGFLDGALWLWWDKVEHIVSNTARKSLTVRLEEKTLRYDLDPEGARSETCADFVERCKIVDDEEKHRAITRLAQEAEVDLPDTPPQRYSPMTWEDVRACERQGMTFGAHTVSHPILSRTTPERALEEIAESWRRVRAEAVEPVPIFCYPSGREADFGDREVSIVRELGFMGALSAESGFADPVRFQKGGDSPFEVERMPFPEDLSILAQYAGGIERFKQSVRKRTRRNGDPVR
jgi:peptidoglycan/xylan/chitin deacetylase (PgdA/CDA1 family)